MQATHLSHIVPPRRTLTHEQAVALAKRNPRNGRPSARSQILAMQAALLADVKNENTPCGYRAQCARAWDVLEERLRIIDGKPLPPVLREMPVKAKRKVAPVVALPDVALKVAPTITDSSAEKSQ